jgi:hypothetical protein
LRSRLRVRLRLRSGDAGKQNPGHNYKPSAFHVQILLISTVIEQAGLARQDIRVTRGRFDSRKPVAISRSFIINKLTIKGAGKNVRNL